MAAVRRRSGAGIVVALVFFVVLAFVGIGGCIWFYQQLDLTKSALATTNEAVETHIGQPFTDYNWPWDQPQADASGLKYTPQVLAPVSDKLAQAREFEANYKGVVGYDSTDDIEQALQNAAGDQKFNTLQGLVGYHNQRYPALVQTTQDLRQRANELEDRRAQDQAEYLEKLEARQKEFDEKVQNLTQTVEQYEKTKDEYKEDLDAARAEMKRLQDQLNERDRKFRARLAEMQQTVQQLNDRIAELQRPTMREEIPELVAMGEITAYKPETGYRAFRGGKNKGIMPNDRFVIYVRAEDGEIQRKAVVQVSAVHDVISEFFIVRKQDDAEIDEGDKVVRLQAWNDYQEAVGGM